MLEQGPGTLWKTACHVIIRRPNDHINMGTVPRNTLLVQLARANSHYMLVLLGSRVYNVYVPHLMNVDHA